MTEASTEMTRRTMAQDKDKGRQETESEDRAESGQQDEIDQVLSAGLRKLYDPILDEQVPSEMLEILKRGRKK